MSDLRLRQLAREARACPSAETESALLRERLRTGELSLERLELAAYCDHQPARSILPRCGDHGHDDDLDEGCHLVADGQPHPAPIHEPGALCVYRDLPEFVSGLSRWGPGPKEIARRVAVVMCKCSAPGDPVGVCAACLRDTTEPVVRAAIQSALISWALGEGK